MSTRHDLVEAMDKVHEADVRLQVVADEIARRNHRLEELVRDMYACLRNGHGRAACKYCDDSRCDFKRRMTMLGIEVD